jgi:hypothetical protein
MSVVVRDDRRKIPRSSESREWVDEGFLGSWERRVRRGGRIGVDLGFDEFAE